MGRKSRDLSAIKGVKKVVSVDDSNGSVCEAIRTHKPTYFANGGDRISGNTPEVELCKEMGVTLIWRCGGEKIQSSSDLISNAKTIEGKKTS